MNNAKRKYIAEFPQIHVAKKQAILLSFMKFPFHAKSFLSYFFFFFFLFFIFFFTTAFFYLLQLLLVHVILGSICS